MAFKVLCSKNDYKNRRWRTGWNLVIHGHVTDGNIKVRLWKWNETIHKNKNIEIYRDMVKSKSSICLEYYGWLMLAMTYGCESEMNKMARKQNQIQ